MDESVSLKMEEKMDSRMRIGLRCPFIVLHLLLPVMQVRTLVKLLRGRILIFKALEIA